MSSYEVKSTDNLLNLNHFKHLCRTKSYNIEPNLGVKKQLNQENGKIWNVNKIEVS